MTIIRKFIKDLRSRPHRVIQDNTVDPHADKSLNSVNWSNLPPELLREVLVKLEAMETHWPSRRSVVACAGVCRSWRVLTKDIVGLPEVSGKLTFPVCIKQSGPKDSLLRCFIKRNRSSHTYCLYACITNALTDDGKFILAARKFRRPTCTEFIISSQAEGTRKNTYVGKLRSNFLGSKFTVYDGEPLFAGGKMSKSRSSRLNLKQMSQKVSSENYPVAQISYELNVLGASRGPRRMQCVMGIDSGVILPTQTNEFSFSNVDLHPSFPFFRSKSMISDNINIGNEGTLVLKNKSPRWHEQLQCWCLNFHGRVTVASVKNFQLVASPEKDDIVLQFGKVGKDLFTMDYGYPMSAFQAFAICLSSFDTKIACE